MFFMLRDINEIAHMNAHVSKKIKKKIYLVHKTVLFRFRCCIWSKGENCEMWKLLYGEGNICAYAMILKMYLRFVLKSNLLDKTRIRPHYGSGNRSAVVQTVIYVF